MEVFQAVRTVLAVREYQDRRVPEDVIKKIVEAGRLSASSMNLQPWHFVVVQESDTLKKLGELAKTGPYIAQAPLAIAVAVEASSKFGPSDASRAVQSMVLTAWAEGLGSNWVGFGGIDEVKTLLAIPAELDLLAIIPFGYPKEAVGTGNKKRKPLGEVASRERFGQPFA